jgi:ABC-type nitrate/sulfonate/bicarbonate transport system substrate-binding protein
MNTEAFAARSALVTRRRLLQTAAAGAVSLSGLALVGCGSAGSSGSTYNVNIVNASATGSLAAGRIMDANGYFKRHGVTAKTTYVATGSQVVAALASGAADLTVFSGLVSIMPAIAQGIQLKVLGGTEVVSTTALFSAEPGIRGIRDLKGQSIGVGAVGSELYDEAVAVLATVGLTASDVTFRNVGSSAESFTAAMAKQVGAGFGQVGDIGAAGKHGGHLVTEIAQSLPLWIENGAVASVSALNSKRQGLVETLAAYVDFFRFMTTDGSKQQYVNAFVAAGGDAAAGAGEWAFIHDQQAYSVSLDLPPAKMEFIQQQNVKNGAQKRVLSFSEYADTSVAADAVKLAQSS